MLPVLKESCCGCSLQTGTKIISIFGLVCSFISVILYSIECNQIKKLPDNEENHKALATAAILITSSILSVGLYSLLIVSAYLRKPKAALPWLVLRAFGFLTDILVFILAIIAKDVFDAVVTPISMIIGLYMWWIVYSFWRELADIEVEYRTLSENDGLLQH